MLKQDVSLRIRLDLRHLTIRTVRRDDERRMVLTWWPVHLLAVLGALLLGGYTPVTMLSALLLALAVDWTLILAMVALTVAALPDAE